MLRQVLATSPLFDAQHEVREPARLDVRADAALMPVQDRAQVDGRLRVPLPPRGLAEGFAAERELLGRQALVKGVQQLLAVEIRLSSLRPTVDAELGIICESQKALVLHPGRHFSDTTGEYPDD